MAYGIGNIDFLITREDYTPPAPDPDPPPDPVTESLFTTQLPLTTGNQDATYTLGTVINTDIDGQIVGARVYIGDLPTTSPEALLYEWVSNGEGILLASKPFGVLVPSSWNEIRFDTPVDVSPLKAYVIAWGPTDNYNATTLFFESDDLVNGHLSSPHNTVGKENGKFQPSATAAYPGQSFNAGCYFVDVLFIPAGA